VRAAFGGLPLAFEPNWGQTAEGVNFLARGAGYTLFLSATQALLATAAPAASRGAPAEDAMDTPRPYIGIQLVNAAAGAAPVGEKPLPGVVSYFRGDDPARWQTGLPTYAEVRYADAYPGIDVVYYGAQGQLEYDFVVTPGAHPSVILLACDGVDELEVGEAGDLQVRGAEWALQQRKPVLYQEADGVRREIAGGYVLRDGGQVGFAVERYDRSQPLIIDP